MLDFVEKNYYNKYFNESSKEYVGISKEEFTNSVLIIDRLEKFMDEKFIISTKNDDKKLHKTSNKNWIQLAIISVMITLILNIQSCILFFMLGSLWFYFKKK